MHRTADACLTNDRPPYYLLLFSSYRIFSYIYCLSSFYYLIINVATFPLLGVLVCRIGSVAHRVERNPLNIHLCTNRKTTTRMLRHGCCIDASWTNTILCSFLPLLYMCIYIYIICVYIVSFFRARIIYRCFPPN